MSGSDDETLKVWDVGPALTFQDIAAVLAAVNTPSNTLDLSLTHVKLGEAGFEVCIMPDSNASAPRAFRFNKHWIDA